MAEKEDELNPQEKAQFWENHIDASQKTGLSQAEYCRQNHLKPCRFWYWKKRLKKIAKEKIRFVPLSISQKNQVQQKTSIITPNGYRIELTDGFDPIVIGRLIHVLRGI